MQRYIKISGFTSLFGLDDCVGFDAGNAANLGGYGPEV